jgi:adenylate cyclase class IV
MTLKIEHEIKIFPVDEVTLYKRLTELRATRASERTLMRRTIFGRENNSNMDVTYIRVRDEGEVVRLSAKQIGTSMGNIEDQKELDTTVQSYQDTIDILKHSGLVASSIQENYRTKYIFQDCEIVIEEWPALPIYCEIEGNDEESVQKVCEILNLNWADRLFIPVSELYAIYYNVDISISLAGIKNITFNNPPTFT